MQTNFLPKSTAPDSSLARNLAVAQQIKDSLTIVGMNVMLIFGILCCGMAVPGLVLYFLRWRLTRGQASREQTQLLWALGVVHEVLCVLLFSSASMREEFGSWSELLVFGYVTGIVISFCGLLVASNEAAAASEGSASEDFHSE